MTTDHAADALGAVAGTLPSQRPSMYARGTRTRTFS